MERAALMLHSCPLPPALARTRFGPSSRCAASLRASESRPADLEQAETPKNPLGVAGTQEAVLIAASLRTSRSRPGPSAARESHTALDAC